ncbi:MAG TPA: DUF4352 domain-containing protein [Acidimicrobiales bacterium]|nr:DUF4352 domain-containing protein [Acidimicrobiales bacterium]
MATTELKCEKHRTPTQLACAQCGRPSCPRCLVWTEVGQKCRTCVPGKGGSQRSSIVVPALVVAVLLVVLLAALGVFSKDSRPELPARGNVGSTQPGVGQPARDGSITFVVTRFDCGAEEVGEGQRVKTALGRYCLLELKATNSGNQPASFAGAQQQLLDSQRRHFAPDATATMVYLQATAPGSVVSPVQQMNPGAEVVTALVYDIPDGVNPQLAELHAGNTLGITVRLTEAAAGG